jgi:hypothetical protein
MDWDRRRLSALIKRVGSHVHTIISRSGIAPLEKQGWRVVASEILSNPVSPVVFYYLILIYWSDGRF